MSKETFILSLRLALLGIFVLLVSIITSWFPNELGDYKCDVIGVCHNTYPKHYTEYIHWGFNHWVIAITVFFIVLVQLIEIFKKEL